MAKRSTKTSPKTGAKTSNSQASSKKKQVAKKERGPLLTTALVIIAIQGIFAAYLYYTQNNAVEAQKPLIYSAMVLHNLANIAAAIGIFYWKKWGLYVYAASALVSVVAGLFSGGSRGIVVHDTAVIHPGLDSTRKKTVLYLAVW